MKFSRCILLTFLLMGSIPACMAVESGMCRLLSVSESEKLILVSRIPDKTKYLLDIAASKITIDGKPAELLDLKGFSVIQVKWNDSDEKRNGVRLDGTAIEIEVNTPEKIENKIEQPMPPDQEANAP